MYLQKVISKKIGRKIIFVGVLTFLTKEQYPEADPNPEADPDPYPGCVSQRYGSPDPGPKLNLLKRRSVPKCHGSVTLLQKRFCVPGTRT
jgi:hypothetical protein